MALHFYADVHMAYSACALLLTEVDSWLPPRDVRWLEMLHCDSLAFNSLAFNSLASKMLPYSRAD